MKPTYRKVERGKNGEDLSCCFVHTFWETAKPPKGVPVEVSCKGGVSIPLSFDESRELWRSLAYFVLVFASDNNEGQKIDSKKNRMHQAMMYARCFERRVVKHTRHEGEDTARAQ